MKDKISEQRIKLLHPSIRDEVKQLIEKAEAVISPRLSIRVVQGLRTWPEQAALYAQGRTKKGPVVTFAKAGSSWHNYGLAFDFAFLVDGKEISWDTKKDFDGDLVPDWLEVVLLFTRAGYTWGGTFTRPKDYPHLQKNVIYTVASVREKYAKKDFIPGTNYVRL